MNLTLNCQFIIVERLLFKVDPTAKNKCVQRPWCLENFAFISYVYFSVMTFLTM